MSRKPILLAWSGGKDSSLALAALHASSEWSVAGLLTTVSQEYDRVSMHGVRRVLLEEQAEALGLPLTVVLIPPAASNASYEERMGETLEVARGRGIGAVAFGDLFLEDVRAYRQKMLASVGMAAVFPIWGRPTDQLAVECIDSGFRAILTCVDTEQLDGGFAGRNYDHSLLADLPSSTDPCGERGEFHSFVFDGPIFRRRVNCVRGERVLRDNRFMYCDLLPAVTPGQGTFGGADREERTRSRKP